MDVVPVQNQSEPVFAYGEPKKQPLVTVVCASFNAGAYLREAVDSILGQTYVNLEFLVVDDGSTDNSFHQLSDIVDPRLRILRQANSGKSVAINRALSQCQGEFIALQDADDISYPDRIAVQAMTLVSEPDLAAVFCGHDLRIAGAVWAPRFRAKSRDECRIDIESLRMPAHDPTVMYRRSVIDGIRFEPRLRIGQGYDHILRVGEVYPMLVIGQCLYSYRIEASSVTHFDPQRRLQAVYEVKRLACERRGLVFEGEAGNREVSTGNSFVDNGLATDFMESVVDLRRSGRFWAAFVNAIVCAWLRPADLHYYKPLLYSILPEKVRRVIRPSERASVKRRK